ncbi:S8 family serine peptidase [Longispora albida]|uniref:S8 family serine peptidase n=1 Tax=Longispora albida TaxID=203523 RepID=UPI0003655E08|nr:S8 family serine peptidase [Longispora albida]
MRRALAGLAAGVLLLALPVPAQADTVRDGQWYTGALRLADVHKISRGAGVTVAVIDSGVHASHPDLAGNVLPGAGPDGGDHGTGVASLVAGHGHGPGSGDGVLGIAPEAKVLAIGRSTSTLDRGMASEQVPAAIDQAIQGGAKVITLAMGGVASTALERAIQRAQAAGVVVVAGTGNTTEPGLGGVEWPARYPGVLAVTATGPDGLIHPVSVTGQGVVLAVPGAELNVASARGGYRKTSGTSLATGIAAGAVAVLRARYPDLTGPEIVKRLTATATDKGPSGVDDQYGHGVLDLLGALNWVPPAGTTSPAAASSGPAVPVRQEQVWPWALGAGVVVVTLAAGVWLAVRRRRSAFRYREAR